MGGFYIGIHVKELRENGLVYTTVRFASLTDSRTWQTFMKGGRLDGCKSVPNCYTGSREQAAGKWGAERRQEGIGRRENRWELGDEGGRQEKGVWRKRRRE